MKKQPIPMSKPSLAAKALAFAEKGAESGAEAVLSAGKGVDATNAKKTAVRGSASTSGKVPESDKRLTANISKRHHIKLKVAAAERDTTVGELIEELIDRHL